jgi:hypothetical protein
MLESLVKVRYAELEIITKILFPFSDGEIVKEFFGRVADIIVYPVREMLFSEISLSWQAVFCHQSATSG